MIRGLYGIADAAFGDPLAQATLLAEEGVSPIQLRCKGWPRDAVRQLALACGGLGSTIIVNDDADLAAELGLCAHLGDTDGPSRGPHGRSTHTLAQVEVERDAVYIGFGPVFATRTKLSVWTPRGLAHLTAAVRATSAPIVAIGGIDQDNLDGVRAAGAAGWAAVGAIWTAADPRAVIRAMRR
ncbi:MAG: thiamine phosphate synthase [Myxococcales bacterium]|nr:thiamine phosphate synthase [Myxococcales bacterium]